MIRKSHHKFRILKPNKACFVQVVVKTWEYFIFYQDLDVWYRLRVCMFSMNMCGFSPGTVVSSHSLKTCVLDLDWTLRRVSLSTSGCLCDLTRNLSAPHLTPPPSLSLTELKQNALCSCYVSLSRWLDSVILVF